MKFTLWERITGRIGRRYWLKRIDVALHRAYEIGWLDSYRLHAIDAKAKYHDEPDAPYLRQPPGASPAKERP